MSLHALKLANAAKTISELQAEARRLSAEQVGVLISSVQSAERFAREMAENPSAPVGVREYARHLAERLRGDRQSLAAIFHRSTAQ